MTASVTLSDYGTEARWIGQDLIPLETPLGVPIVNPFSHKQMQFFKQYKVTGISLDEARTGILFSNYRPFMDVKEETYSRSGRTRHLIFNPFARELEKYGEYIGRVGVISGWTMASMMGMMLGLISWDITEESQTDSTVASFEFKTSSRFFWGRFRIRARAVADGVVLEDDWTTRGGSDMRTSFLPMANLVLLTHPKGFEQIAAALVDEVKRARAAGLPYTGEIGAPSVELRDKKPTNGTLDTSTFIVLGESLAAGMTNFGLTETDQRRSFAALTARQLGASFALPLVQAPGIGNPHGFPSVSVQLPTDLQTTVLVDLPPKERVSNLSVPGLTVDDVVSRRPVLPLIHQHDARQTAINLIFDLPGLLGGSASMATLLEIAVSRRPTLALVALGSAEVLEAATAGDVSRLPDPAAFGSNYRFMLSALRANGGAIIASTIPDPIDTAYFSSLEAASHVVKLPAMILAGAFHLQPEDRITPNGLIEIGCQLGARTMGPLAEGSVVPAQAVAAIRSRVAALNADIAVAARENDATVFALDAVIRRMATDGLSIGSRTLTAEFLGGIYSMNGYTPGATGHAAIANELIGVLNTTYNGGFSTVDLASIAAADPVADYQQPQGPEFSMADMATAAQASGAQASNGPVPTVGPRARSKAKTPAGRPSAGSSLPLRLPEGLVQQLPLVADASYFGDAIRPVHTTDSDEAVYGLTGNLLFGGLALTDSRLNGALRITFSEPQDNVTHFEVSVGEGLTGEDGRLEAPQFFKLPNIQQKVAQPPGMPISGDLDLGTGQVANVKAAFMFMNSALFSLVSVNPTFPKVPVSFPGEYGTALAKFEQRPDGQLDFTFEGTTFVPLSIIGAPARFPLPFFTPQFNFASVPANGTSLHPHIRLSTRPVEPAPAGGKVPDLPANTVVEFVASVHNNSFGDDIDLNVADLGGPAAGRSHLTGRVQVQFGPRFDDMKIPIAMTVLAPGGQLANLPQSPFAQAFKRAIPNGMYGHNELLKFPKQTYRMDGVSFLCDPLDISHGVVDLKTGQVIGNLLMRGLITTNWLLAMVMLEDRTPRASFQFRGPAAFEAGVNGQLVFRYNSGLVIPFPEGFRFPKPDLQSVYSVGPKSRLEPFVRLQAMYVAEQPNGIVSGSGTRTKASTGDEFSYRYAVTAGSGPSSFEYTNHTQDATFTMRTLTWVGFLNSRTAKSRPGEYDTVTFTGLGSWSKDASGEPHIVAVQICTSRDNPYVTIQVDGAVTSNVNTKPEDAPSTLP